MCACSVRYIPSILIKYRHVYIMYVCLSWKTRSHEVTICGTCLLNLVERGRKCSTIQLNRRASVFLRYGSCSIIKRCRGYVYVRFRDPEAARLFFCIEVMPPIWFLASGDFLKKTWGPTKRVWRLRLLLLHVILFINIYWLSILLISYVTLHVRACL